MRKDKDINPFNLNILTLLMQKPFLVPFRIHLLHTSNPNFQTLLQEEKREELNTIPTSLISSDNKRISFGSLPSNKPQLASLIPKLQESQSTLQFFNPSSKHHLFTFFNHKGTTSSTTSCLNSQTTKTLTLISSQVEKQRTQNKTNFHNL